MRNLTSKQKLVLTKLRHALVDQPGTSGMNDGDAVMLDGIARMLFEFPRLHRLGMLWALFVFNWLPVMFGFGFREFVHLEPDVARQYTHRWLDSQVATFRDMVMGLRGLVMFTYFSNARFWEYIGYNPLAHAQERTHLRERLMRREERQDSLEDAMAYARENSGSEPE